MVLSNIWWNQLPSSVRLVDLLKEDLSDDRNIILVCKTGIPWKDEFYRKIKRELGDITATRALVNIAGESGVSPGKIVLNSICSPEVQANYWPGQSYAEYLSSLDKSLLNERFVWVDNITDNDSASMWLDFVNDYNRLSKQHNAEQQRAVFILECTGNLNFCTKSECFSSYDITPSEFDRYMFCVMNTSELDCSYSVKQYIAELAFNLGGDNIQLSGQLALKGVELLEYPLNVYNDMCRKEMLSYDEIKSEIQVNSNILISQMKIIFPVLEQKRQMLINKYRTLFSPYLPIKNAFNEIVSEVNELELSSLLMMANQYQLPLNGEDKKMLQFCKDMRNKIAHNDHLPGYQIRTILEQ